MASTAQTAPRRGPVSAAAVETAGERRLPRGPRVPAIAQTILWALVPTWLMRSCAERLGESFTLTLWPSGLQFVMVSDPEAVKQVFTAPPEVAPSAAGSSPVAPIVGKSSVLTLTGPEHMRQRKLLLPPFHGERMRAYEDVIVEATRRDMATWELGQPMRMIEHSRAITLEVILRAVFGVEAERMDALRTVIATLMAPVNALTVLLLALRGPITERPTGALGGALDRMDALIYEEIARRREQGDLAQREDIMSLLLQACDEDGQPMTDRELRDELVTLLLAGHETTATSVAWAIERLVRHPEQLRRLVAEIDSEREGREGPGGEAGEAQNGSGAEGRYLSAVVDETLRLRPVVPLVARMLKRELEVGPYRMPPGTRVAPCIYLVNRNPRVYEDPDEFRPERFLENGPETFSWIPFGGGIRRCIGASFAQLEMRLILRTVLSELQPSLPTGRRAAGELRRRKGEWTQRRAITLVPGAGARVVWTAR
jgi:cytochrome P450 family 135